MHVNNRRSPASAIVPGIDQPARRTAVEAVWDEALCAETDPEIFFPEKGQPTRAALAVCAACPVRELCLATFGPITPHGVVGGTTAQQRREMYSRRAGVAA
jgi:WhiB family transcriptional regulator, redox-sensing transcriptional regulator